MLAIRETQLTTPALNFYLLSTAGGMGLENSLAGVNLRIASLLVVRDGNKLRSQYNNKCAQTTVIANITTTII